METIPSVSIGTMGLADHLFQERYKAILVQKEAFLLKLTRYVVLNPVRAGKVKSIGGVAVEQFSVNA